MNSIVMMVHGKYNSVSLVKNFLFDSSQHLINLFCSITLDYACDAKPDCLDKSDEIGCDQIEFDESYDKTIPLNNDGKIVFFVLKAQRVRCLDKTFIFREVDFEYGYDH